jgi:hypothetical protein
MTFGGAIFRPYHPPQTKQTKQTKQALILLENLPPQRPKHTIAETKQAKHRSGLFRMFRIAFLTVLRLATEKAPQKQGPFRMFRMFPLCQRMGETARVPAPSAAARPPMGWRSSFLSGVSWSGCTASADASIGRRWQLPIMGAGR